MSKQDWSNYLPEIMGEAVTERVRAVAPSSLRVTSRFWASVFEAPHLSQRMKHLILLAMNASSSSLNEDAARRHVQEALKAGATEADILDVLISIIGLANHALYFTVPILVDELASAGVAEPGGPAELRADLAEIKEDFIKTRGFWNEQRDQLARLMPDYFKALSDLSTEPWKNASLSPKEKEFIYISIDSSITHMHEGGLRMHIRNALKHGATKEELLEVLQFASIMGVESYIMGSRALADAAVAPKK